MLELDAARRGRREQARHAHGLERVQPVIERVDHGLDDGGRDAAAARRPDHQADVAAVEHDGRRDGGDAGPPAAARRCVDRLVGEAEAGVVQEEARDPGADAEERAVGLRQGNGVALGVHDGEVRGLTVLVRNVRSVRSVRSVRDVRGVRGVRNVRRVPVGRVVRGRRHHPVRRGAGSARGGRGAPLGGGRDGSRRAVGLVAGAVAGRRCVVVGARVRRLHPFRYGSGPDQPRAGARERLGDDPGRGHRRPVGVVVGRARGRADAQRGCQDVERRGGAGRRAEPRQVERLEQLEGVQHLHPGLGRRRGEDGQPAVLRAERAHPPRPVGGEVAGCGGVAAGVERRDHALGDRSLVEPRTAVGSDAPEGLGQLGVAEDVARAERPTAGPVPREGIGEEAQLRRVAGDHGGQDLADREAVPGQSDRRSQHALERKPAPTLVQLQQPGHAAGDADDAQVARPALPRGVAAERLGHL